MDEAERKEKAKARDAAYRAAHREGVKARDAAYRAAHREEVKARRADRLRAHPQPQRLHALRELSRVRRSAGLCSCGAPARPDRTGCQRCADACRDRVRLHRQAKRELAADPLFTELATTHTEPTPF